MSIGKTKNPLRDFLVDYSFSLLLLTLSPGSSRRTSQLQDLQEFLEMIDKPNNIIKVGQIICQTLAEINPKFCNKKINPMSIMAKPINIYF